MTVWDDLSALEDAVLHHEERAVVGGLFSRLRASISAAIPAPAATGEYDEVIANLLDDQIGNATHTRRKAAAAITALQARVGELERELLAANELRHTMSRHWGNAEERIAELEKLRNRQIAMLRQCYITLAFAFNRLHESSRSRDGELCMDFQKVRAQIEKLFNDVEVKL